MAGTQTIQPVSLGGAYCGLMSTKSGRPSNTHFEQITVEEARAAAAQSTNFPSACPRCSRFDAFPYRARTALGSAGVYVDMRCRHCEHEWQIDRSSPLSLRPAGTS